MKKTLFTLTISAALLLSACNDKQVQELTQKLQTAKQSVARLETELAQARAETAKLQQEIPVLYMKQAVIFDKSEKFNVEGKSEYNWTETGIHYSATTAESGIDWLDGLLYRKLSGNIELENKAKEQEIKAIQDPKQQYLAFLEYQYNLSRESIAKGEEYPSDNYSTNVEYVGQRNNILTFAQENYTYSGGAHGMYNTDYFNIDINKKAVITLDDLFPGKTKEKLTALLWEAYQIRNGNMGREPSIEKSEFYISDSFYFNAEGMEFVYPPYALGAYAEGEITLILYWNELIDVINPEYSWKRSKTF